MATADSPGPGTMANLNPFRRSVGVSQSQRGFVSVWSYVEVLRIKCYFCNSDTSVIGAGIKCDFCIRASL